jgi:hypothetical protein
LNSSFVVEKSRNAFIEIETAEGDMAQIFARATSIGFDSGQLVGLSMSLTETTLSAMAVYGSENVSKNGRSEASASGDDLRQLGSYVRELGRAVEQASAFQRPENLVSKLLSRLSGESTMDRYDAFNKINDNLLGALSRLSGQRASAYS